MSGSGNWVIEKTVSVGTGKITLGGTFDGFSRFRGNAPTGLVWYSIEDGSNKEAGLGTFDGDSTLFRTTVQATLVDGVYNDVSPTSISLTGSAIVSCTFNKSSYTSLLADIASNLASIASNDAHIATNTANIVINAAAILANTANITSNTNNIATNVTAIGLNTTERGITENNRALIAISKVLKGAFSIGSTVLTDVQNTTIYTGNGATQSINTGIESEDINWVTGTAYAVGDIRFTRDGSGVTAGAFTLWMCNANHTSGVGATSLGESAYWDSVADDTIMYHKSSKVWIKNRGVGQNNYVIDTLRGSGLAIVTDLTNSELDHTAFFTAFTATGFDLAGGVSAYNANTETFVVWQEAYHKVMITTSSGTKKALIAFDDVSNRSMVMYQGSGLAGHEISHGIGDTLNRFTVKSLTQAGTNWLVNKGDTDKALLLNSDIAELTSSAYFGAIPTDLVFTVGTDIQTNSATETFIAYCEANSASIKIDTYSGTGVAGNAIDCGFKPSRVKFKTISIADAWRIVDNLRGDNYLQADSSAVEVAQDLTDFYATGFTLKGNTSNNLGQDYIFIAYADTDADGGGSEEQIPTDGVTLSVTDGVIGYSDGYTVNGADNTSEVISGTITPTFAQGINYIRKEEGGVYTATLIEPVFGKTSSIADYYLNGIWYNSSDVAYTTPISYLPYKLEADIDLNPVNIVDFDVPDITVKSVNVQEITGLDKPIFVGYLPTSLDTAGLIFPWTVVKDTHNTMNGGIWVCPKTGNYSVSINAKTEHSTSTPTGVEAQVFHNNTEISRLWEQGGSQTGISYNQASIDIEHDFVKGDILYVLCVIAASNHKFLGSASSTVKYTQMTLEFLGSKYNNVN